METTTFSGPIKAGVIKETTGTTLGSDVKNTGQVVMAQSQAITQADGTTKIVIPANSQIIDIVIDQITAANTTTNYSIGDVAGGAATLLNTYASGTDAGRKYPTTQAGAALAWEDVGTTDIRLTFTSSAATNAGEVRFTILYSQNNNLA